MDINKENNITEEALSEVEENVTPEAEAEVSEIETETVTETAEDTPVVETDDAEATADAIEDGVAEDEADTTLSINTADIDEELMRYGLYSEHEAQFGEEEIDVPVKKSVFQKPIVIAALAFILTVALVFGSYFVYGLFSPKGLEGTWVQADVENPNLYLTFEEGTVTMNIGGYQRYGYYEIEEVGSFEKLKTDFYEMVLSMGKNILITYSDDNKNMTLNILYEDVDLSTLDPETKDFTAYSMGSLEFKRAKEADLTIDPSVITHASADEFGITTLNIDDSIVGSWRLELMGAEGKYETYTFNADGTGSHDIDYVFYDMYGFGMGEKNQFKYTVHEDYILVTTSYFAGDNSDLSLKYHIDKDKLVINDMGYEKVQ